MGSKNEMEVASTGIIHQVQCLAELIACATFTFCTELCCVCIYFFLGSILTLSARVSACALVIFVLEQDTKTGKEER